MLNPGEQLTSPNGTYRLVMQTDGNLVLYRGGSALWATGGQGAGARAVMQADGNLVVYNGSTAKWSSSTGGFDGSILKLQDDGNLVVYDAGRAIWSWAGGYGGHSLAPGQQLVPGRMLRSPNGTYRMVMQTDGNLVLYRGGQALWATGGTGAGSRLVMQEDGNLVVYNGQTAKWSSNGGGFGGANLVVQDDGNAVVYHSGHAIWTWGAGYTGDTLNGGAALAPGAYLKSPNHAYTLIMQPADSNLVIYGPSGALWGSGGDGQGGASAIMQQDGNFVVQRGSKVLWNTGTGGKSGAFVRMQDDDNLVVYQAATPLWSRKAAVGPPLGDDYPANLRNAPQDSMFDPWGFYNRECTSFVAWRMNRDGGAGSFSNGMRGGWFGNANTWASNAQRIGMTVTTTPTIGAIAQWAGGEGKGDLGHVAYVQGVNGDGSVTIEQYNVVRGAYSVATNVRAPRYIRVR